MDKLFHYDYIGQTDSYLQACWHTIATQGEIGLKWHDFDSFVKAWQWMCDDIHRMLKESPSGKKEAKRAEDESPQHFVDEIMRCQAKLNNQPSPTEVKLMERGIEVYSGMLEYSTARVAMMTPLLDYRNDVGAINCAYNISQFLRNEERLFYLSENLCTYLTATDVDTIKWRNVRTPFPAFAIRVPKETYFLLDPNTSDDQMVARDLSNKEVEIEVGEYLSTIYVSCETGDEGYITEIRAYFVGPAEKDHGSRDSVFYFHLDPKKPEYTVKQLIGYMGDRWDGRGSGDITKYEYTLSKNLEWCARFLVKTLLYLVSEDRDVKETNVPNAKILAKLESPDKKERKHAENLMATKFQHKQFVVGGTIQIDNRFKKILKSEGGTGHKLQVQSYVRGHYRNQPWGPGRCYVKTIFIEPFWRGPKHAPINHPTYSVVGGKD